jgi:aspartate/methionine/tyrosine aminotransferase
MHHISYEIRDVVARARKVQATGKKIHWFNIGDPNLFGFAPPHWITDAIVEALKNPKYTGYCPSEGDPELREVVGKIEGVVSENVTIHSGLSEGIDFLFQALVDPGDNVLLPSPSYPLYNTKLKVNGGVNNYYLTDDMFHPHTDDIRKRINSRTRAIVVINPNNPTGALYPRKLLKDISDIAGEHNVPLISDEIYNMLALDDETPISMRDIAKDVPLIVGNGISKNYIYPGARVGYLALHGEGMDDLRTSLVKLCNQRLSVNWEMQRGALAAFTHKPDHLPKFKSELRKRRDIVHKGLNAIHGVKCVKPMAAFYAFPTIHMCKKTIVDRKFISELLEETGVLVLPGSAFSPHVPDDHFRMVYLAQPDELQEAIGKMESFITSRCH